MSLITTFSFTFFCSLAATLHHTNRGNPMLRTTIRLFSSAAKSMDDSVLVRQTGALTTVTLNRPKALNSLNLDMCRSITSIWKETNKRGTDNAILMVGAGGKAFCAGGDVKSVYESCKANRDRIGWGTPGDISSDFFREEYEMNYLLGTSPLPQVSFWNGIVMGGGVGVSVLGKFRIATETTLFAMPETAIGLFPDVGSSSWLPHLSDGVGEYIALTGVRLKAEDLLRCGIATHYLNNSQLTALEERLAAPAANNAKMQHVTSILEELQAAAEPRTGAVAFSHLEQHGDTIQKCFDKKESVEEIFESLAAEAEKNKFALDTLATLRKMSPRSLKLTLRQLQLGRALDLKECLNMEYRMVQGCMRAGDFQEGIRALLIDKDNKPQWSPDSIRNVTDADIETYLSPLGQYELQLQHVRYD